MANNKFPCSLSICIFPILAKTLPLDITLDTVAITALAVIIRETTIYKPNLHQAIFPRFPHPYLIIPSPILFQLTLFSP